MEKGCKKLNSVEKKLNFIIMVFCIIICYIVIKYCYNNWNSFIDLFKNSKGLLDNSIIWNAISAIGTIFAFIGVIITIICTEKSRIKQNEFEYKKEKLLVKQNEFEEYLRSLEEIFDPLQLVNELNKFNENNIPEINQMIFNYISKLYNVESNFNWFFDSEISAGDEHMKLLEKINNYREEMNKNSNELSIIIQNFYFNKAQIFQGTIDNGVIKDNNINTKINDEIIKANEKIFAISQQILAYRNFHLPILNNLLRNSALERENKVNEKLNFMK